MIDTLFFDGDQTLWDFDKVMRGALRSTLTELRAHRPGAATDRLTVDELIADRQAVARPGTTLEHLRVLAFRRTLERLDLPDNGLAEHLGAIYLERRFARVALYPDTLPALERLRSQYTLGLVSNGNSYPDRAGLADLFTVTVFSQDQGVAKPDPRLFEIAAAQADRAPGSIAMIGDSLVNDVDAAKACGWYAIWLNRTDAPCPPAHEPDAVITTLSALPDVLPSG